MVTTRFGCITEPPARSWRRRLARALPGFGIAAGVAVLLVAAFEYGRAAQARGATDRYRVEHWLLLEDMRGGGPLAESAVIRASTRTIALIRELGVQSRRNPDDVVRQRSKDQLVHLRREVEEASHKR